MHTENFMGFFFYEKRNTTDFKQHKEHHYAELCLFSSAYLFVCVLYILHFNFYVLIFQYFVTI